ncbi:HNH endonuclease, partial [Enterococcus faecium]|uniref:HNH endonuclease n=1 Tax=Enterococcus faecium TaxID=1352 RepID=UPI003AAD97F8
QFRIKFNEVCMTRDKNVCRLCELKPAVDVHHITSRKLMPNGGYVLENGISLCSECHLDVELEPTHPAYDTEVLYGLIGSNYELALQASINNF